MSAFLSNKNGDLKMIKVDRAEENVCNSCMESNAYKILCMTNEHNGCALYLCETCMNKVVQVVEEETLAKHIKMQLRSILGK
jgi:hypothetical protein